MKHIFTIITAGLITLLSLSSCGIHYNNNEFNAVSIDAYLTGYYAGGFLSETTQGRYDIDGWYISDKYIERIFNELSLYLPETFYEADLEIIYYDWMDNPVDGRLYNFWWVMDDYTTGRGHYEWREVFD